VETMRRTVNTLKPIDEEELFLAAIALSIDERPDYLDAVCAGAWPLRQRLEQLLESHEERWFMAPAAPRRSESFPHIPLPELSGCYREFAGAGAMAGNAFS
jgi:hypothetical protein